MSVNIAALGPQQLKCYAVGYTEARDELADELAELRQLVAALSAEVIQARQDADRVYHEAYCGCNKTAAADAIRGIEIATARAASNNKFK